MLTPNSSFSATPRVALRRALAIGTAISFAFDTAAFGSGPHTIVTRVVYDGVELARQTAAVKLN